MGEYWVAGAFVLAGIGFWDWPDYYHQGLIDGHEWKENRFRWL
jgi:hypothetical protein